VGDLTRRPMPATFRMTAEFAEAGGDVTWQTTVEVTGEWVTGAGIARAIAEVGNKVADALAERDRQ